MTTAQGDLARAAGALLRSAVVWDNHACLPLRPYDLRFLPQLERLRAAGVSVVSLNVGFDLHEPKLAFAMLETFRDWVADHPEGFGLVTTVDDIACLKAQGRLGVVFDLEGGRAVEDDPSRIERFYRLGVRWMLIAYNRSNRLGGGCQDEDGGLTELGRRVIDEMERVGMVLCCAHTGYRTAREALAYARRPVIFSHANPRALHDHDRNVPDDLIRACAATGGVFNLSGLGLLLGGNDNSTETLVRHIDYVTALVGPAHVGLGLDYVFDQRELDDLVRERPDLYPPDKGYSAGIAMIEPERWPAIAEALLARGYSDAEVRGVLGENNLRVAREVWR